MAVKKTYRINLRNYGSPPAVMVSQYDEGYAIAFEIFDGPLPVLASSLSGYTFKLKGRQPGNPPFLAYEFEGTLATALNAVVSFEIDTTMTGRAGKGTAELVILDEENDVKFASVNFAVYTEPAAVPDGSIDADVQRAMEIAEEVQEIVDTAAAEVKGEAEAWAVGQRDGEDVPSTDPTYENNAKYYAEQAQDIADSIGIDATLSISGKAADAKKTGDEISSLKEDLNAVQDFTKITRTYNKNVSHTATVLISTSKLDINATTINTVEILLTDTAVPVGTSFVLYYRENAEAESVSYSTVIVGTAKKFVFPVNVKSIGFYADSLSTGTLTISVSVSTANNMKDVTDNLLLTGVLTSEYQRGYIALNGSIGGTVDTTVVYSSPTALHLIRQCKKGDEFIITGTGGSAPRLWGLTDLSYKLLSVAPASREESNKSVKVEQDGFFISNVFNNKAYALTYKHYFSELEYNELATKTNIIPLNTAVQDRELRGTVSSTWYYSQGDVNKGGDLLFPFALKKGEQFIVELVDDSNIIGAVLPFYYVTDTTPSSNVRRGSLSPNTPTVLTADIDIKGVYFYLGSSQIITTNGTFSIRCDFISNTEQRVIDNTVNRFFDVPDYYFENNYLDDKVSAIKSAIADTGGNGDVFIFITDEHWDVNQKKSVGLINYINHQISIPRLFDGGDTKMAGIDEEFVDLLDNCFNGRIYHVVGNHEYLNSTTEGMIYRDFYLKGYDQIGNPERHYYYVDNPQQKIRYVVLNSYAEVPEGGTAASAGYEAEQVSWFENVALNVNAGWTIVIFTHVLYHFAGDYSSMYPASQDINDAILNYSGDGIIACVIQGHSHRDCIHYLGNVPVIITTCDKNTTWTDPTTQTPDINVDRTSGTINEQAFDVFVIDKTAKEIKAIRIGAKALDGIDTTEGDPVDVRTVTY